MPRRPKKYHKKKPVYKIPKELSPLFAVLIILCFIKAYFIYILIFAAAIATVVCLCKCASTQEQDAHNEASIREHKTDPEPEPEREPNSAVQAPVPAVSIPPEIKVTFECEDEMLPVAIEVCVQSGAVAVSAIQRQLHIGYNRAARIVDEMEELGIAGPFSGSRPRAILITKEQWENMKVKG